MGLGSGIPIQGPQRFRIPDPDPQHCQKIFTFLFSCIFFPIFGSVADQGCLFRIPDPDFYAFRISDPKIATKKRGPDPDPYWVRIRIGIQPEMRIRDPVPSGSLDPYRIEE